MGSGTILLLATYAYTIAPVSTPYDGGEDATSTLAAADEAILTR